MGRFAMLSWGMLALACDRGIGRPPSGVVVDRLEVIPAFVQAGVPFRLEFSVLGGGPAAVNYQIGSERFPCRAVGVGDGRISCEHFGLERASEGPIPVRVEVTDAEGRTSGADATVTLDLTCPRAIAANLSPAVAEPGDVAVLTVEVSEPLSMPPRVSRLGQDWGVPEGDGRLYRLERRIGAEEPGPTAPVQVVLVDRAGNTNLDCGLPVQIDFAVDRRRPVVDGAAALLLRGPPGGNAVLTATAGAFSDDVGVVSVDVLDANSLALLARVTPSEDGGLEPFTLPARTSGRVLLEARDPFGRSSGRISISEAWSVGLGNGATAEVFLGTGVRRHPAPPRSRGLTRRTAEAAPDVARADARSLLVRARVGFEKIGELPSTHADAVQPFTGFEPRSGTIMVVGGHRGPDFNFFANYMADVLQLRWDPREGRYDVERLDPLSFTDPERPPPGYGPRIAFDGEGCGLLHGGSYRTAPNQIRATADVWRLCVVPGAVEWERVRFQGDEAPGTRFAPIVFDPIHGRYVAGGTVSFETRVAIIEPGGPGQRWRARALDPLPTTMSLSNGGYLVFDPRTRGLAFGLGGGKNAFSNQWSYVDGVWRSSDVPFALAFRAAFGWAYDEARRHVVVWGGGDTPGQIADAGVWYQAGTATTGPSGWRRVELEAPEPRDYPAVVYDPEREVVLAFGGVREDQRNLPANQRRTIAPDVFQLVSEPAYPYVQTEVELGAARPEGIEAIELFLRAAGAGDASGGVEVLLWDHLAGAFARVGGDPGAAPGVLRDLNVRVRDRPHRFIAPDGWMALALRSASPATEARPARLEVDVLSGVLLLRPGVSP